MKANYEDLVAAARAGSQDALTGLYEATSGLAWYIAMQLVRNEQDALDVMQGAYLYAFRNLDALREAASFESWMARIVTGHAKNLLRKNRSLPPARLTEEEKNAPEVADERPGADPQRQLETAEAGRAVRAIVAGLSEAQRLAVMMYYFGDMSVGEIAAELALPENTVKSRLNYARQKIKKEVERLRDEEGYRLYGAPLALFAAGLWQQAAAGRLAPELSGQLLAGVQAQLAAGAAAGGASATGGAAAGATAGAAKGAVAAGISGKLVAGIIAGAVAFGGVTAAVVGTRAAEAGATTSLSAPAPPEAPAPGAGDASGAGTSAPAPEAPDEAVPDEAWRQVFYDTAAANLRHGELEARELCLYYTEQGPLMSISYGVLYKEEIPNAPAHYSLYARVYKAWRVEGGQAVLQLEVDSGADRFADPGPQPDASTVWLGANAESGNLILMQVGVNWENAWEIVDGERAPLFLNGATQASSQMLVFADGRQWTAGETTAQRPLADFPFSGPGDSLTLYSSTAGASDETRLAQLGGFLLGGYDPDLPAGAPAWVGDYLRYIRCQLPGLYAGGSLAEGSLTEISLTARGAGAEGAPALRFVPDRATRPGSLLVLTGEGGSRQYPGQTDGDYRLWADAAGKAVLCKESSGYQVWSLPGGWGEEFLFLDGTGPEQLGTTVSLPDGTVQTLPTGRTYHVITEDVAGSTVVEGLEAAEALVAGKRAVSFSAHGLAGPVAPLEEVAYPLPAGAGWPQLEQAVVNALCAHAQAMGQWG